MTSSFEIILEEAKERYFQGESEEARTLLEGLELRVRAGEQVRWSATVDALTYLGEIHYLLGDQEGAKRAFQYLLERDPETPISPYHHPIEVVNFFDLVRELVRNTPDDPPPELEAGPVPLWTFLPIGTPQLLQDRTGAGIGYGLLQAGLGAVSIGAYVYADRLNPRPPPYPPEIDPRIDQIRYFVQWPATIGFYGVWTISIIDAAVWHKRHPKRAVPPPEVSFVPIPEGTAVLVRGRF